MISFHGASQGPSQIRKQMGRSVYLLAELLQHTPSNWSGKEPVWVAGGLIVSDRELAKRLEVTIPTVKNWRSRLRKIGVIGWLLSPGKGRAYWITPLTQQAGISREHQPGNPAPSEPGEATEDTKQEPAPRWIQ